MSNWDIDGRVQLKGNSGPVLVYQGQIFTGAGVLGGAIGTLEDSGTFFLLFFDEANIPNVGDQCDFPLGPIVGPNPFSINAMNRPMFKGCSWALSSTFPLYTPVTGNQGVYISWTSWGL